MEPTCQAIFLRPLSLYLRIGPYLSEAVVFTGVHRHLPPALGVGHFHVLHSLCAQVQVQGLQPLGQRMEYLLQLQVQVAQVVKIHLVRVQIGMER